MDDSLRQPCSSTADAWVEVGGVPWPYRFKADQQEPVLSIHGFRLPERKPAKKKGPRLQTPKALVTPSLRPCM